MISIDYVCFLNASGYSQAAQDAISALSRSKMFDVRVTCIHRMPVRSAFSRSSFKFYNDLCLKPYKHDAVQIFHCIPDKQKRFKRLNKSMSFATFETFQPPEHWIRALNGMDAVICPSEFNFKIFAHAGVRRPLFHIPHTIDVEKWNADVIPSKRHECFTFLFVGTWRMRKGCNLLLQSWYEEFSIRDNVQLIIHTDKSDKAKRDSLDIKKSIGLEKKDTAPIFIEDNVIDDLSLPSFFKSADCLVAPSLGEGFGLPALQCMALKVPVITTNFGGCKDYASADTCTLIEPSGFVVHDCLDNIPQFKNKKWPRITIQSVRTAMRCVFENRKENIVKAENAYIKVQDSFNHNVTIEKFLEMIEMVYNVSKTTPQTV